MPNSPSRWLAHLLDDDDTLLVAAGAGAARRRGPDAVEKSLDRVGIPFVEARHPVVDPLLDVGCSACRLYATRSGAAREQEELARLLLHLQILLSLFVDRAGKLAIIHAAKASDACCHPVVCRLGNLLGDHGGHVAGDMAAAPRGGVARWVGNEFVSQSGCTHVWW